MAISKVKKEALGIVVKDLREKWHRLLTKINMNKRTLKELGWEQARLKQERKALVVLSRKLEDGLLGTLGRFCYECQQFGDHVTWCRFKPKEVA